ncbi:hypothetical protein [Planosporangium mesophilum]
MAELRSCWKPVTSSSTGSANSSARRKRSGATADRRSRSWPTPPACRPCPRTVNTGMGALFILIALAVLGGESLLDFALALLIGVIAGTYSPVFVATPLAVTFENRPGGLGAVLGRPGTTRGRTSTRTPDATSEPAAAETAETAATVVESPTGASGTVDLTVFPARPAGSGARPSRKLHR